MKDWLDPTSSGATVIDGIGMSPFNFTLTPATVAVCNTTASTTVDLAATYDAGFTGTVTLAASGNPSPSTTFAPPGLTPPTAASVLTLGSLSGVPIGSYTIAVSGTSGADSVSKNLSLTISEALSGSPALLSPADGATEVSTSTTLSWNALSGTTEYTVEIATDATFTNVVVTQAGITATSYPASGLNPSTTYYWRVTPTNGCGDGTTSDVFSFTTANIICRNPALAIPDATPAGVNDTNTIADTSELAGLKLSIKTTHTYVGDLKYTLTHGATSVTAIDRPGYTGSGFGCSGDDIDVTLDDAAASPVETACSTTPPAIGGTLSPNNPLAAFIGQTFDGTWTLNVSDNAGGDTGSLTEWCLIPEVAVDDTIFVDGFDGD